LRCLRRLQLLSTAGLLLISADKGSHQLAALQGMPLPALVRHGSLSLHVNYHAYRALCEREGGLALFPSYQHSSIVIGCLLLLPRAASYAETRRAYQRYVEEWNPDDFHTVFSYAGRAQVALGLEEILAFMRMSAYDSYQCTRYLPHLLALAPSLSRPRQWAVGAALNKIWAGYFPLGEQIDLAYQIACVFYAMGDYPEALSFFAESIALYGQFTGTLYNMAMCYHMLNAPAEAKQLLCAILADDPSHDQASAFLDQI
jgi:tetratricopeptide (TPR) repeat protein